METAVKNIKNDFQHVFVEGNAKSQELARVLILLDIPLMIMILYFCHFV